MPLPRCKLGQKKKAEKEDAFPQALHGQQGCCRLRVGPATGMCGREDITPNGEGIRERRVNISKGKRGNYVSSWSSKSAPLETRMED